MADNPPSEIQTLIDNHMGREVLSGMRGCANVDGLGSKKGAHQRIGEALH